MLLWELAPTALSARDLHGRCPAHEAAETGQAGRGHPAHGSCPTHILGRIQCSVCSTSLCQQLCTQGWGGQGAQRCFARSSEARDDAGWLPEDVAEAQGWQSTAMLLKSLPPVQSAPADDSDVELDRHRVEI